MIDPMEHLKRTPDASVSDMIEGIIHWTQSKYGTEEFISAKTEFHALTGRVFPDEPFYHQRMSYFLDFFTFQRPIQGMLRENDGGFTPFSHFLDSEFFGKSKKFSALKERFIDLGNFKYSLFMILKVNKNKMILRDLFDKEKIEFGKNHHFIFNGFSYGAIFQGFIFHLASAPQISRGVILHPPNVSRIIRKSIRQLKKDQNPDKLKLMSRLAKQHLNFVRQRFGDSKKIYSQVPR
ncbi:MAG: hypothetical protein HRU09_00695 [Oligoflexales bacterium]|nr:hypothetical protein [Oligoflexales bacterium]